jgi:nicotinamide-nucleotide amidase
MKPVGLVVFAKAERGSDEVLAEERNFPPTTRGEIRAEAVKVALELLRPGSTLEGDGCPVI